MYLWNTNIDIMVSFLNVSLSIYIINRKNIKTISLFSFKLKFVVNNIFFFCPLWGGGFKLIFFKFICPCMQPYFITVYI